MACHGYGPARRALLNSPSIRPPPPPPATSFLRHSDAAATALNAHLLWLQTRCNMQTTASASGRSRRTGLGVRPLAPHAVHHPRQSAGSYAGSLMSNVIDLQREYDEQVAGASKFVSYHIMKCCLRSAGRERQHAFFDGDVPRPQLDAESVLRQEGHGEALLRPFTTSSSPFASCVTCPSWLSGEGPLVIWQQR